MDLRPLTTLFLLPVLFFTCTQKSTIRKDESKTMISVIPKPVKAEPLEGNFKFNQDIVITIKNDELKQTAEYLTEWLKKTMGIMPQIKDEQKTGIIELLLGGDNLLDGEEAYQLKIRPEKIQIIARNDKGIFYGIQTLRQLVPAEYQTRSAEHRSAISVPCLIVEDAPRFGWRGMMLDVSRHFFSKEFIKDFIDYLAMYKLNTFHWHLVDDQGWRIEIKKYPKLTDVGAWRVDREDRHWNDRPDQEPGEEATYGGFYTQEDVKEIVDYAQSRHIKVIPEIEMPGHTVAALSAYPQYSCTGGPFTVLPGGYWPISDIYCSGNDSTFEFLQNILTEVMNLFPGKYIHVGGDEAEKSNWKKCEKCQARIKNENLADEHELQSYFIKRMESFINEKGRILIGWDEILEGGLAPQATVMSWRGTEGGITAAQAGHQVVMSPTSHCYFDYYQGPEEHEPLAIGGYLPLTKVYEFDPVPDELIVEEGKYILGGQANLWTEYIPDPQHAQYMIFPRITALAEAVWTQKDKKNWDNFSARVEREMRRYEYLKINYAKSSFLIGFDTRMNLDNNQFSVLLSIEMPNTDIRYTLDKTDPTYDSYLYSDPISIDKNVVIKAAAFKQHNRISPVFEKSLELYKSTGKNVVLIQSPAEKYSGSGKFTLTNSLRGSLNYADGRWLGFEEINMEAVIDLGSQMEIKKISSSYLNNPQSWIFLPRRIKYALSSDGKKFNSIADIKNIYPESFSEKKIVEFPTEIGAYQARYVRVYAENVGVCPDWHMGTGGKAWLFVDELMVE